MVNEKELKRIPYGVSDFKDFYDCNLYYVDKTHFIKIIEDKGKYLLLNRPRRFGKSLFLAVLHAYYDIAYKDQFDSLFNGTYIHNNPTSQRNSYMVLKFNFSSVDSNISNVEKAFLSNIRDSSCNFIDKYHDLLEIEAGEVKNKLEAAESPAILLNTLFRYCSGKKNKLYVIIDEYDNFANTILTTSGQDIFKKITHGEGFFRAFFNTLKSGTSEMNAPVSRLFISGVSPITLDDVTSGFNIATNISLHPDLSDIMGFTAKEVEILIEYYRHTGKIKHSTKELMDIMGQWYNHYRFSTQSAEEVFNTVHIWYFLQEYLLTSIIPQELIDSNARIDYNKLRHLIFIDKEGKKETNGNFLKLRHILETGTAQTYIKKSFPVETLTESENFYSLLYYFGLLTIKGISPSGLALLGIPNEFVKHLFYDYFKETINEAYLFHIDMGIFSNLLEDMAFKGYWEPLVKYIGERMENSLGLRDLMTHEKAHQVFWNAYLGLGKIYNVYSEKELNQGYADLLLEPLSSQNLGIKFSYIIEIKYIKPSELQKLAKEDIEKKIQNLCNEASIQLDKYSHDERFKKAIHPSSLKKLILVFSGNRLIHYSEV